MPGGESAKKLFSKSQPLETFQWKEHSNASLALNSLALQQCSQGHVFASEREGSINSNRGCGDVVDSSDLENCRSSRNIKSEAVPVGSLNDLNFTNAVKGSGALEGSISCSESSHLPSETDYSNFKKSENLRCSGEQMEGYSRIPSKSNSVQSLTDHENSLEKTLSTSLKLIAANSATSPLAHSSVHSYGESFRAETVSCTSNSNASGAVKRIVIRSPVEPSGQSHNVTVKKCQPKASLKKAEKLSKRKSRDEMMKPILSKYESVTLFVCKKCSKVFNKKQNLRQHSITHTDRFACSYCDTRCNSKGDLHSAKADSAKADSAKADSASAESADAKSADAKSADAESADTESANTDSILAESENADSAKAHSAKAGSDQADSAKTDSANTDRAKAESRKACEVLKGEVPFSRH